MTEEQIIQNAEEHATKYDIGRPFIHHSLRAAYIEGAKSREKEIEQLQHELAALSKVKAYALHVGDDVREDIRIFRMAENYLQEFVCIKIEEDEKNRYNNNMYGIRYENEDITDAYQQGMRDAYDNPKNPWISVEDRLPENNKTVLVWFGGYYTVAVLRDDEWWACTGYQTSGGWSALDKIPDIASSYITHWMYIPKAPEPENKKTQQ